MAGAASIATLTILGASAFVILAVFNLGFFLKLEGGLVDWLRHATSWKRIAALLDGLMTIVFAFDFLSLILIVLI